MDESMDLTFSEKFEFQSRRRNMMWSATQKIFSLLETRSIPLPPSIQASPRNVEYQEETFLIENRSLYLAYKKNPSLQAA